MYTLTPEDIVFRDEDGAAIPNDPRNVDRQAYEQWVAAGNVPHPFIAPTPAVPASVSNYQARAALIEAGLFDQVDAAISASGNALAIAAWNHAQVIQRDSPFIGALKVAAGLDDEKIDQLFLAAAAVT